METIKSKTKRKKKSSPRKKERVEARTPEADSSSEPPANSGDCEVLSRGSELFNQLIRLTGMPAKTLKTELSGILERKGLDLDHLTVDDLRTVVASYLREIMSSVLDRVPTSKNNELHH